ncbi:hypothetical protein E2C01_090895 [Portunus trituberculatus]|uniref:Uncharacterized protein n=1 Tax=Portunus trituberculatus TaxID=210409 RepID=A0A5B7JM42_PORTR|nr:hypothetical protein [Portunus trituberculatus]
MALRWALTTLALLVTCSALGLSHPQEVTGRDTDTPGGSSLAEEENGDSRMAKNTVEETGNTVNTEAEVTGEQFPVSSQEGMRFETLQKIMRGIMYIIDSYFDSASLGDWLATLGKAAREESQELARDWKFSPPVVELIDALRPLGFIPYPDPYIPIGVSKNDIWKVTLNWLGVFGIIGLFCKYETSITDLHCCGLPGLTAHVSYVGVAAKCVNA